MAGCPGDESKESPRIGRLGQGGRRALGRTFSSHLPAGSGTREENCCTDNLGTLQH